VVVVTRMGAPRAWSRYNRATPDEVGSRCWGQGGCDHGCAHTYSPIPHVSICQSPHKCTYLLVHHQMVVGKGTVASSCCCRFGTSSGATGWGNFGFGGLATDGGTVSVPSGFPRRVPLLPPCRKGLEAAHLVSNHKKEWCVLSIDECVTCSVLGSATIVKASAFKVSDEATPRSMNSLWCPRALSKHSDGLSTFPHNFLFVRCFDGRIVHQGASGYVSVAGRRRNSRHPTTGSSGKRRCQRWRGSPWYRRWSC
jgi:hypothetical protein